MDAIKTYDYLTKTRERVFDAVRPLTPQQYRRPFDFGLGNIASTLTHVMISEWYYVERLDGRPVAPYEQWPIQYEKPPEFATVESTWRPQAERVRASLARQSDWGRVVSYLSFPDESGKRFQISATAGDFFAQLVMHEVHHRAQLMAMLRLLGDGVRPVQDLDYNDLMFERREVK